MNAEKRVDLNCKQNIWFESGEIFIELVVGDIPDCGIDREATLARNEVPPLTSTWVLPRLSKAP